MFNKLPNENSEEDELERTNSNAVNYIKAGDLQVNEHKPGK